MTQQPHPRYWTYHPKEGDTWVDEHTGNKWIFTKEDWSIIDSEAIRLKKAKKAKCTCGVEKTGVLEAGPRHSDWCDRYYKE